MIRPPPISPLFPSPTLSRSLERLIVRRRAVVDAFALLPSVGARRLPFQRLAETNPRARFARPGLRPFARQLDPLAHAIDRKSTRLNSSHSQISYAVFCLKKK